MAKYERHSPSKALEGIQLMFPLTIHHFKNSEKCLACETHCPKCSGAGERQKSYPTSLILGVTSDGQRKRTVVFTQVITESESA
jgi:hypothetical protein